MKISISQLRSLIESKLSPPYTKVEAEMMTEVIMYGELSGRKSHGLIRLLKGSAGVFVDGEHGTIHIEHRSKISSVIHGSNNPGLLVGPVALQESLRIAKEHDISLVGTVGSTHSTGAISYYCQKFAEAGFISLIFTQSSPFVAPFGAKEPLFGTNPISFGIPHTDEPIIFDMSTASIAYGDLKRYELEGKSLPEGIAQDSEGKATLDPQEAMRGSILPFDNGYKGSALAMMVEILGSVLPGGSFMGLHEDQGWGNTFIVFSPTLFSDRQDYEHRLDEFKKKFLSVETPEDDIRLPGAKTMETYKRTVALGYTEVEDELIRKIQSITH